MKIPKIKNKSLSYFLTTMIVYLVFFIISLALVDLLLTILQAHPYIHLLVAIIILIIDIIFTNFIVNIHWRDKWILK